jgi:periplasmic copper chaperone A
MNRILPLIAVLALAACNAPPQKAAPSAATRVEVTDVWCRATPNGARAGGCYATLTARGGDDRLVSVSTDRAETSQIHEMSMENGMMKMGELAGGLPLPAEQAQSLAPGGNHIMLMGLTGPLVAGETVSLALTFQHAPAMGVRAEVRAIGASGAAEHSAH